MSNLAHRYREYLAGEKIHDDLVKATSMFQGNA